MYLLLLECMPPAPPTTATFSAYFTGIDGIVTALSTFAIAVLTGVIAYYAYGAYLASKKSLVANKEALVESKKANLDVAKFNSKQAFENTFFKLLDFHNTKYTEMYFLFPNNDKRIYGGEAFKAMYLQLRDNYLDAVDNKRTALELIKAAFAALYLNHSQIGAYYKNLYMLVKYIDHAEHIEGRELYISILKAQLTRYEILLLPYDCIWIEGDKDVNKEFTTLVGRYDLLSALERDGLFDRRGDEAVFQAKGLIE